MGKFNINQTDKGQYYFNLKANNGEIILASQRYSAKANCQNGIESVRVNSQDDSKFERLPSKDGQHYFNLMASNGQVIGTSETYTTKQGMENGISSVKTNAPGAGISDNT